MQDNCRVESDFLCFFIKLFTVFLSMVCLFLNGSTYSVGNRRWGHIWLGAVCIVSLFWRHARGLLLNAGLNKRIFSTETLKWWQTSIMLGVCSASVFMWLVVIVLKNIFYYYLRSVATVGIEPGTYWIIEYYVNRDVSGVGLLPCSGDRLSFYWHFYCQISVDGWDRNRDLSDSKLIS